uniref:Leishmanolysin-like peptidase n=1 Tax=Panagrolaimus sp. ES5 TaxID=591445 RepID=A0AC34GP65_9BILA
MPSDFGKKHCLFDEHMLPLGLVASEPHPSCVDRCKEVTTCGEVAIPDEHLFQCRFCALPTPLACTSTGPTDGPGVTDADFVLYVSAVNSNRCKNEDTIAYAAHCQQEADLDRPIAGHVNICPSALSTHLHDQEILLSTVKHEILHALGFSAGLYAFFRDEHGNPRTKRNRYNRPPSFNRERGYYDADDSTVKTIIRDWWTSEGTIPHPVHVMVTERVRDEVRKHFGCNVLEGAELENQGGDGTALTHWEKRLFENEAMTGTHTQNPVYSRVTLALMEDSGWYKANYDGLPLAPFCHDIKHDGKKSLATTRCTDQRDSLALCNLVPYKKALPKDYRNFDHLDGVKKEGLKFYGGSVELADFCPYNQEFEWRAVNTTDRRDSRCELEGNFPGEHTNSIMEIYGNSSKCFDLFTTWTEKKCGRVKNYSQYMAGCYGFICLDGRLHLEVFNSSELYPCYHEGQNIHIKQIHNGWLREGIIVCPSCNELCNMHRQIGNEPFNCLPDINPPNGGYVGDETLNEPCGGSLNFKNSFIFIISRCMIFVIISLMCYC